jgi:hypothetical protein
MTIMTMFMLCCILTAASVSSSTVIRVGVVLGVNNGSTHLLHRALTSDQEQWCANEAQRDFDSLLAAAQSPFTFQLDRVYAGEDSDSAASEAVVLDFITAEAAAGVGAVVGGYMSDKTLLVAKTTAAKAGVVLLASASGLPVLPPPRTAVVRFWPNDGWHAGDGVYGARF